MYASVWVNLNGRVAESFAFLIPLVLYSLVASHFGNQREA